MMLFQNKHYEWKNNELITRWILEETNQYIPDTDLLKEYSHVATDYYESGEVVHVNNKSVYYYTKL